MGYLYRLGDVIAQKRGKFTKDQFDLNDAKLARIPVLARLFINMSGLPWQMIRKPYLFPMKKC
jgi:hypothetical protein